MTCFLEREQEKAKIQYPKHFSCVCCEENKVTAQKTVFAYLFSLLLYLKSYLSQSQKKKHNSGSQHLKATIPENRQIIPFAMDAID